jgi:hypothetical protein
LSASHRWPSHSMKSGCRRSNCSTDCFRMFRTRARFVIVGASLYLSSHRKRAPSEDTTDDDVERRVDQRVLTGRVDGCLRPDAVDAFRVQRSPDVLACDGVAVAPYGEES